MIRALLLTLAAVLGFAGCTGTREVQRPERPVRPDRPGWIDPYPASEMRTRPARPIRPYPGLTPW